MAGFKTFGTGTEAGLRAENSGLAGSGGCVRIPRVRSLSASWNSGLSNLLQLVNQKSQYCQVGQIAGFTVTTLHHYFLS